MNRFLTVLVSLTTATAFAAEEPKPRTDLYGDPLPPGAVMRYGTIRLRHYGADVTFSKDGKQLISCGTDGEVRVWDVATGELRRRTPLAWKPDDSDIRLRDVALSAEGAVAAVWDHVTLILFDTASGKERHRLSTPTNTPAPSLRISPDGKKIAVEVWDKQKLRHMIRLWDSVSGEMHDVLLDRGVVCLSEIAFAADGKRLAWIAEFEKLTLRDATTGAEIPRPKEREAVRGRSVTFSPDGKLLAVSDRSKPIVYLLDAATWEEKDRLQAPASVITPIERLVFSSDGRRLAGVHGEAIGPPGQQGVLVWDVAGTKQARHLPQSPNSRLRFAPDGKTLACHSGTEIRLWDAISGRQRQPRPGHDWSVETLVVSPDGQTLVTSAVGYKLLFWDAATCRLRHELEMAGNNVNQCRFTFDGKRLITGGHAPRGGYVLQMWDSATRKERWRFMIPSGGTPLHTLGISPDGKRLSATVEVADDDTEKMIANAMRLQVWNADTGQVLNQRPYRMEVQTSKGGGLGGGDIRKEYRDHTIFAPDGTTMSVWQGIEDVSTGQLFSKLPNTVSRHQAFSADGRYLAASLVEPNGWTDGERNRKFVSLFETASGEELFHWELKMTEYISFTPDGRAVVAANRDILCVWDATTGKQLHRMAWPASIRDRRGKANVCSLAVLPGGSRGKRHEGRRHPRMGLGIFDLAGSPGDGGTRP